MTTNCWEFTLCGREPGGVRVAELGVCPASSFTRANGFLGGQNGGRACAYIAGTLCDGAVQGTHADKTKSCHRCEFFKTLRKAHGDACSVYAFAAHVRRHTR